MSGPDAPSPVASDGRRPAVPGPDWRPVARADDIPDGALRRVEIDGRRLALGRDGERWFAVDDACPHRGAPFSEMGRVRDGRLVCTWHFWQFDLATLRHCDIAAICLAGYPVRIRNGAVEIDVGGRSTG